MVNNSILYYFVDTNLFLQCRPLEQLDWSLWGTLEEVRLIVSKPVLREIDKFKNKGNERTRRRARDTSSMFRQMRVDGERVVHDSNPRVVLCVESQHQYSKDLIDQLNYDERDDQLVGTTYEFARRNQNCDVRLLTHDTTPMFTASGIGLVADQISDDWLLPPEQSDTEKKLASLQDENARLKKAEPRILIQCMDQSDSQVDRYEHTYKRFDPLTHEQIDELMHRLRTYFPLGKNFGPTEPQQRIANRSMTARQSILDVLGKKEVFSPATAGEIAKYREQAYPQWVEQCEQVLRQYHSILQKETPRLTFSFIAKNDGTRPATDCLVTVEARGNFLIMPPHFGEDDDDELQERQPAKLSLPPNPPTGHWRSMKGPYDFDHIGPAFRQIAEGSRYLDRILNPPFVASSPIEFPRLELPRPHDSNEFYYKPDRPSIPQGSFSLECDNWRHGNDDEAFAGEIHLELDQETAKGALVCRIQASNLSKSVCKTIPVRITIVHISAFECAKTMVEHLIKSANLGPN